MPHVKVSTTTRGHEDWVLELDVDPGTTVAALKDLLARPPHNLKVQAGNRVLEKRGGVLMSLPDEKPVKSEVALLNFVPAEPEQEQPAQPVQPQQPQARLQQVPAQGQPTGSREWWMARAKEQKDFFDHLVLEHRAAPPVERLFWSYSRSIQFAVSMLGLVGNRQVRLGTWERPRVIWVLNCTDEVEVTLARLDCWTEANWLDRCPTDLILMGHEVDELEMDPAERPPRIPADPGGWTPRVRTVPYSAVRRERSPDIVLLLMPQMGQRNLSGSAPCNGSAEVPKDVLFCLRGAPVVLSLRRNVPLASLNKFSGKRVIIMTPIRNMFSQLYGREGTTFDNNGWIMAVESGDPEVLPAILKMDMLPEFQDAGRTGDEHETKSPALFWGILDLKYDASASIFERVRVLETGDGRTSRFSGAGAVILKRYRDKYRLEDGPGTGKSAVISANKKLTHDLMVQRYYSHLVPKQVCFNRIYSEDLVEKIMAGLEVGEDDVVVLKLANRTRAAGVLPVPVLDLDNMLKKVLIPPDDIDAWLSKELARGDEAALHIGYGCLEEQIRHWWSNECPFFVVERMATSTPTTSNWSGEEREYDGTMRIAFALHRTKTAQKAKNSSHDPLASSQMPPPEDIEIDWLGAYWKLPKEPTESCKLRDSIISSAKTGTSYVETNHLLEVFAMMSDSVQQLFGGVEPVAATLAEHYAAEPELAAYLVGRIGIAMRDLSSCRRTVEMARKMLDRAEESPTKLCAQSFVSRGLGVVDGMTPPGRWTEAKVHLERSIEQLPANASSLYLYGQAQLELGQTVLAVEYMRKAMVLDLDFRAPYVNLGVAYLRLQKFDEAIAVSEAGLKRHPESPQCNYHIAMACYHKSLQLEGQHRPTMETKEAYESIRARGLKEMMDARDSDEAQRAQHRSRVEPPFLEEDDMLVEALKQNNGFLTRKRDPKVRSHRPLQLQPDVGWRFVGWRT